MTTTDIFKRCSPVIYTDIDRCGSVTVCNGTSPAVASDLDTLFKDGSDWRILEALFGAQMETKACGVVQNSWEDFFMANLKPMKKNLRFDNLGASKTLLKIRPFILAKQKRPINNVYWRVSGGTAASTNWRVDLLSNSGIPSDVRSFTAGERLYIQSMTAGGSKNWWQGVIVSASIVSGKVRVILTPQNAGSAFDSVENPVTGIAQRGSVNIGKTESFCDNEPGYIANNEFPYWLEHTKMTLCDSEDVREFRKFVLENNPLYREFYDLPEVEENQQRTKAFWSKLFNNAMFSAPISAFQNLNEYNQLPQITNFIANTGFGVGGGACDGYKANNVGWLQQWQTCGRVRDLQGATLDLWSLMDAIYQMHRVRLGVGSAAATSFDLFTDGTTADILERGFIKLFKDVSSDTMRMVEEITSGKNATFGFSYRSFRLKGKCTGITLNIITHFGLDDYLAEWNDFGDEDAGRFLWLLDMSGMSIGVVESTQRDSTSGKWEDLVKVNPAYQCVEDTKTKSVRQIGITYTSMVNCPASDLVLHNFASEIPVYVISDDRPSYLPADSEIYGY